MTNAPTAEEFLAQPSEPDEELDLILPAAMAEAMPSPLAQIAESLATIAKAAHVSTYLDQQATDLARAYDEARRELADAEALNQIQADLIERVTKIVKPSTSKLANSVREALGSASFVAKAEPEAPVNATDEHNNDQDAPPAADASVEEWRAFARGRGYAGPDVDKANRSQIRTMLGLPHAEPTS
jgi:uncharacterized protein YyaL (SSP411 family)